MIETPEVAFTSFLVHFTSEVGVGVVVVVVVDV